MARDLSSIQCFPSERGVKFYQLKWVICEIIMPSFRPLLSVSHNDRFSSYGRSLPKSWYSSSTLCKMINMSILQKKIDQLNKTKVSQRPSHSNQSPFVIAIESQAPGDGRIRKWKPRFADRLFLRTGSFDFCQYILHIFRLMPQIIALSWLNCHLSII